MTFRYTPFRVAVAALAITTIASCSKDKTTDPTPTPAAGMGWTMDGGSVTATAASATTLGTDLAILGLTGSASAGNGILLSIPPRTGTFAIDATANSVAGALFTPPTGNTLSATTGSIVVTTYSPSTTAGASNVVGTFTFTASDGTITKTFTNGKFNVKY